MYVVHLKKFSLQKEMKHAKSGRDPFPHQFILIFKIYFRKLLNNQVHLEEPTCLELDVLLKFISWIGEPNIFFIVDITGRSDCVYKHQIPFSASFYNINDNKHFVRNNKTNKFIVQQKDSAKLIQMTFAKPESLTGAH
jgi:hypothetical protein